MFLLLQAVVAGNSFYNCNYRVTPGINKLIIISLITWSYTQFSFLVP